MLRHNKITILVMLLRESLLQHYYKHSISEQKAHSAHTQQMSMLKENNMPPHH